MRSFNRMATPRAARKLLRGWELVGEQHFEDSGDEVTRATDFYEVIGGTFFAASVDGHVLPDDPQALITAGTYNHVPLVVGTTTAEMSQFIWAFIARAPTTEAEYRADVQRFFGSWTPRLLAAYPTASYGSQLSALEAMFADWAFLCPSRDLARGAARSQVEPVRRYVFSHAFDNPQLAADGAAHGYDVFFALHNLGGAEIHATPAELALGDTLVGYFTRFAATGDPNGDGAPSWPSYETTTHEHLRLDVQISVGDGDRDPQCDLWAELYGGS
jgi:para-nitrobenzyl esterase